MANYKNYDYAQRMMIPVSFDDQIIPGTLEFAIHHAIEHRLDLSCFDSKFKNDGIGRPAYNPKILLKVILLAYSRGITSSRKIEQMCHENVLFMAMACDQKCDHTTLANFVADMGPEIYSVFLGVLLICEEMELLGGTLFALDGTKIPGNASKEMSGTRSELRHKKALFIGRLKRLINRHQTTDSQERKSGSGENPHFKRQKEKLERSIEKITRFLERSKKRVGKRQKELKSNVTDPDSGKMKTGNGTIQGYNSQAYVDSKHQIIVAAQAMSNSADNNHYQPMTLNLKENLRAIGYSEKALENIQTTTDSGYYGSENIRFSKDEKIVAYLPDPMFRSRDPRYAGQMKYRTPAKFPLSAFRYDEKANAYFCPAGQLLTSYGRNLKRGGRIVRQYVGKKAICQACHKKDHCLRGKRAFRKTLQFPVDEGLTSEIAEMQDRVDSDLGRHIYSQRFKIVEPVFANIKTQKGLRRFTVRGKIKVDTQWLLWCMVHNLEKIANYGDWKR